MWISYWQIPHKILTNVVSAPVSVTFYIVCIPAISPQISLSLWQLSFLFNRSFCQQDTDIKDRLLHNQCLKCDYNQMCMQIVSEAEDFAISHRYMLLEQSFMSCHQKESVRHRMYAIWQKKVDLHHDT